MIDRWSRTDVEKKLLELEEQGKLFPGYGFVIKSGRPVLLGTGGSAYVYEMEKGRHRYALKIIGFKGWLADHDLWEKMISLQESLGSESENTVRIADHKEIQDGQLRLQLVLMEKLIPVLSYYNADGKYHLYQPPGQKGGIEQQTLKIATDVGKAIKAAHDRKILHRDIKLENIFYDEKKKIYKLGDFGGAEITDNGFVKTHLATKGYGAPEVVGSMDQMYDCTADIYSFGITLYRLLNRLNYPDSDNAYPNLSMQYTRGYMVPRTADGSDALFAVIQRMCMYDPDDRYQDMKSVLDDIAGAVYGIRLGRMKKSNAGTLTFSIVFCYGGIALWECLSKNYNYEHLPMENSVFIWDFLALALFISFYKKSDQLLIRLAMLTVSIYYCARHEFMPLGFILLMISLGSKGPFALFFAGVLAEADVTGFLIKTGIFERSTAAYRPLWLAYALLLMAAFMYFFWYMVENCMTADRFTQIELRRNHLMIIVSVLCLLAAGLGFVAAIMPGYRGNPAIIRMVSIFTGNTPTDEVERVVEYQLRYLLLAVGAFSAAARII